MKQEPHRFDKVEHQRRFLAAFGACGSIVTAARWAKISRGSHYVWMNDGSDYPTRFTEAEARASRTLEDEAVRRAHQGLRKAVRHRGRIVGYETEYSDSLLLALLKANNPAKFKDRSEVSGPGGGAIPITLIDQILKSE